MNGGRASYHYAYDDDELILTTYFGCFLEIISTLEMKVNDSTKIESYKSSLV